MPFSSFVEQALPKFSLLLTLLHHQKLDSFSFNNSLSQEVSKNLLKTIQIYTAIVFNRILFTSSPIKKLLLATS